MRELNLQETGIVSGGISADTAYSTAVGAGVGLLAIALTVTAPIWGTGLLLVGSIAASGLAIHRVLAE